MAITGPMTSQKSGSVNPTTRITGPMTGNPAYNPKQVTQPVTTPTTPTATTPNSLTNIPLDLSASKQSSSANLSPVAQTKALSTATKIDTGIQKNFPQTISQQNELAIDPASLKADPKKAINDAWEALKGSVVEEKQRINDYLSLYKQKPKSVSEVVGKELKVVTGAAGVIFSPLSALFAAANDIPVLGSISRLITLPFTVVGEGATAISNSVIDKLPIQQTTKDNLKQGVGELSALVAQIALGKAVEIGGKEFKKLETKYGTTDAIALVNKANEIAKETPRQLTAPADLLISHEGAPDVKTVAQYKADIKAGKTIEPLKVIREGEKYGIEDGKHRFQAYRELGIKDIPIEIVEARNPITGPMVQAQPEVAKVSKTEVKPKVVSVPREQLPVGGGEQKVSGLEARVKGVLDKTSPDVVEKMGLSTYESMSKPDQIKKATDFVTKNQEEALQILMGEKEAPVGLLKNSIYVAMDQLASKDIGLATKLASLESTRFGQELSILTEINPDSPVKIMKDVIDIREKAFEKRTGKTASKAREEAVKSVDKEVKNARPKVDEWKKFIAEIECGGI